MTFGPEKSKTLSVAFRPESRPIFVRWIAVALSTLLMKFWLADPDRATPSVTRALMSRWMKYWVLFLSGVVPLPGLKRRGGCSWLRGLRGMGMGKN